MTPWCGICLSQPETRREKNRRVRRENMRKLIHRMGLLEALDAMTSYMPDEKQLSAFGDAAFGLCSKLSVDEELRLAGHLSVLAQRAIERARLKAVTKDINNLTEKMSDLKTRIGNLETTKPTKE